MYFSVSQFPEVKNNQQSTRLMQLAKPYLYTPSAVYLLHALVLCLVIFVNQIPFIDETSWLTKSIIFFAYLISISLVGVNTWKRRQFLAQYSILLEQLHIPEIESQQGSLQKHWQEQSINKTFTLYTPAFSQLKTYEFGYLSLSENGEKALIRVLNEQDLPAGHIKVSILNEQVIPALLEKQTVVQLTISEQPISATITDIQLPQVRRVSVQRLDIDFTKELIIIDFGQLPNSLSVNPTVKLNQSDIEYTLKLNHIDGQNLVAYTLVGDHYERPILSQDTLIFDDPNDMPLRAIVIGITQLAEYPINHYGAALNGGTIN